jgi:alpha-tubulin suppressor-like RCC1 family protein
MSGFVELLTPTVVTKKNVVVKSVKCGYSHTLILQNDGSLSSFGCNQFGQLGLGREVCGGPQIRQINLKDVVKIKASNFSVALTKDS